MKKILYVVLLGSFLGFSLNASACDGVKAKAKKASTEKVTGATTASVIPVVKPMKKEDCNSHNPKECKAKTGMDCSKDTKASNTTGDHSCCMKKSKS